jgi:sulfotransferase family protein
MAFSSKGIQVALADIEDILFKSELSTINLDRPVFITALPRAGTTILLNLLVETGLFVSHTYRDMPFVLCPVIWNQFSKYFRVSDYKRERAHGDGLKVSADSAEAFEEMIWNHYWPGHYQSNKIKPWSICNDDEFTTFLKNHLKKIILIRKQDKERFPRYISKNNLNISRLNCLPEIITDAKIIVLFREPLQHAYSLLAQHKNFLNAHHNDEFMKAYMKGIGHFDFGENFRPIDFGSWLDQNHHQDELDINYWLEYWIATYGDVLSNLKSPVQLLSYNVLTDSPISSLQKLASYLEIDNPENLIAQSGILRLTRKYEIDTTNISRNIIESSEELYNALEGRAFNK